MRGPSRALSRPAVCLLIALSLVWPPHHASAQNAAGATLLQISGPVGQTLIVIVQYFDKDQPGKLTTNRLEIDDPATGVVMEQGHAGLRIFVVIPTKLPVQVVLRDGGQVMKEVASKQPQVLALELGEVPADDAFQPPRAFLDAAERELVESVLGSLGQTSTQSLVSNASSANIEWQTLDAYGQAVVAELGPLRPESMQLDGWLSWDGSLGARVVSGPVAFERGECRLRLMHIDGRLVDAVNTCRLMPEDWFTGPSDAAAYIDRSETLIRSLWAADASRAHALFSPIYHNEVTPEVLAELSRSLIKRFGSKLKAVELKRSWLGPYDSEAGTATFSVQQTLDFAGGKRGVATTNFVFTSGGDEVGKSHLESVQVREAWQSTDPALVERTQTSLEHLFAKPPTSAERWLAAAHPQLTPHFDRPAFSELSQQVQDAWQSMAEDIDWDLWTANALGDNLQARGPVSVQGGTIEVEVNFAEGQLVGLTLVGPSFAGSTLNLVADTNTLAEEGRLFWQRLLTGQTAEAYALLSADFHNQFPATELASMLQNSGLGDLPPLQSVELDQVRFSDRLERVTPVALTAYYIARMEGDVFLPVRCEFAASAVAKDGFELVHFNTDFETTFPVAPQPQATQIIQAFLSGETTTVAALLPAQQRDQIDPHVLSAFLKNLKRYAGNAQPPQQAKLLHVYTAGDRHEKLFAMIKTEHGQLPFEATLQLGVLQSFYFSAPELLDFASQIESVDGISQMGIEFISTWMNNNQTPQATEWMVPALRTEAVVTQLTHLRDQLEDELGTFLVAEMIDWTATSNRITARFEADFAQETIPLEIEFEVNAFGGLIRSVQRVSAKP